MKLGDVAKERITVIRQLVRGAQRYHYASLQDKNVVVAARHNAYAVALVDVLWSISSEEEVMTVAKISLKKLRTEILEVQDKLEGKAFEFLEILRKKGVTIPGF